MMGVVEFELIECYIEKVDIIALYPVQLETFTQSGLCYVRLAL